VFQSTALETGVVISDVGLVVSTVMNPVVGVAWIPVSELAAVIWYV
jgi:hypothetical protein